MKRLFKKSLQSLLIVPALALGVSVAMPVFQAAPASAQFDQGLQDGADSSKGKDQQAELFGDQGIFKTITNVLLFIIGAISVIMLIIGGIRYTVSNGDSAAVTSAKNTILYAVIGIVVAILAYALVNFVIDSFSANSTA
ncbi:MAG TPA: pilin [Candidatus Saccharimonadales bacterium]|nr:pilin [Candidatus Saccharimonadales bacterium]